MVEAVSRELSVMGRNVQVITASNSHLSEKNHPRIIGLKYFEIAHVPFTPGLLWYLLMLPKNSLMHLHIAHAFFPEQVFIASKIRKIPYIVHFHLDVGPSTFLGPLFLLYKKIVWGPVLRSASKVIVLSNEQLSLVSSKYGVKKENIVIVSNGVGQEFIKIGKERKSFSKTLRLLSVGRLAIQKRPERLLYAMLSLNVPVHMTFVGDGEDREKLETLARELKLTNVTFVGKKFGDELLEYYRNSDVFLISSDEEGMPLVVLEAMASGLPVIGTDVIGTRELVKDTGLLVAEPYLQNFTYAISKLHYNPELVKELSQKSVEKASSYTWASAVEKITKIYTDILKNDVVSQNRNREIEFWDNVSKRDKEWIVSTPKEEIEQFIVDKIRRGNTRWWEPMIGKLEGKKILDIGCGTTFFATYWSLTGNDSFGSDYSPETIKTNNLLHEKLGLKKNFYVASSEKIDAADNSLDVVHMRWVIHHIPPELQNSSMYEIKRVLKPGGKLIVFETNYAYPFRWIVQTPILRSLNFLRHYAINKGWLDPEEKALTNEGYINLIENNGFKINIVDHDFTFFYYPVSLLTRNEFIRNLVREFDNTIRSIISDRFSKDIKIIAEKYE